MTINIEKLRQYSSEDKIFVTNHAVERFRERGISIRDIYNAINNGEIIEQYPNDYPYLRAVWYWAIICAARRYI